MAGKINIYRIKRMVRSNPYTRKAMDRIYEVLTGQYIERKNISQKGEPIYYVIRPCSYAKQGLMQL